MSDEKKIILPNSESHLRESEKTHRTIKREKEDESFVPVIVKRNDQTIRHPDDVLEKAIDEGLEQHRRTNISLLLSSISAGLILGFAVMCVSLTSQIFDSSSEFVYNRLAMALVYPLGFIICIMSGTQLFTEHTATAVYPVLEKKASITSLFRLWGIVVFGNILGTLISSYLIYSTNSVILAKAGTVDIFNHFIDFSFSEIFLSGILAGWLMAQGGWLLLATTSTSAQIFCIYIVTFIIGLGGLHHSIAGSAEIFGGLFFSPNADMMKSICAICAAVFGNVVGGSFFVAILNYSHIRKTQIE